MLSRHYIYPHFLMISDFYLKVCLLQQSKVIKSKKTDTVKRTHCPVFNESFIFKVHQDDLETVSLSITAMQYCIGQKGTFPAPQIYIRRAGILIASQCLFCFI